MEYTKQTWTAPTGTGLSRYAKSAESASHVTLTLDPVNLTNTPTPFTMERMAHMEEGIAKAYDTAPPTPWAQYSGKDIPQLPDNLAGTTAKRDNDWTTNDGWVPSFSSSTISVENSVLVVTPTGSVAYTTTAKTGNYTEKTVIAIIRKTIGNYKIQARNTNLGYDDIVFVSQELGYGKVLLVGYISTGYDYVRIYGDQNTAPFYIEKVYIGTGAYDRLVFDNSYHYRHLLNNAVIPTPQGLYFNGATSYLRTKELVTLPDVFTFSATVNCAIKSDTQAFISQGGQTASPYILVYRKSSTDSLLITGSNGISGIIILNATNFFTGLDNTDIKIEISVDFINKTIKAYRNGIQFGSTVSVPTMVKPITDNIYFGDYVTGSGKLLGYMRNIQLYDTALTDTQRNWLAQGNTPPILYDVTNYETENLSDSLVGMIAAFSGTEDFSSWLFCDGRAVSRTQYSKLFARIGITWGAGNTTTTFNLPDLREVTLVGAGNSPRAMTDPDVFNPAQFKDATFKSHTHVYKDYKTTIIPEATSGGVTILSIMPDFIDTNPTGSTVTRANSMGVGYFIRSL